MMAGKLETLLERIRDGAADAAEITDAQALVRGDARLPVDLREIALADAEDLQVDAVALLAVLGAEPLFGEALREVIAVESAEAPQSWEAEDGWAEIAAVLREELRREAVGFEVADRVMRRLRDPGWVLGSVTAEAVRHEAGEVDVSGAVMAAAGQSIPDVSAAVRYEAGEVDVSAEVMSVLGVLSLPLAEAVRLEAGSVDVAAAVMSAVGVPSPVVEPAPIPEPANTSWRFGVGALLMAAVALVVLSVGQVQRFNTAGESPMVFAMAKNVVVEDLQYSADVQVFQAEGDEGAVIIWVDEEA